MPAPRSAPTASPRQDTEPDPLSWADSGVRLSSSHPFEPGKERDSAFRCQSHSRAGAAGSGAGTKRPIVHPGGGESAGAQRPGGRCPPRPTKASSAAPGPWQGREGARGNVNMGYCHPEHGGTRRGDQTAQAGEGRAGVRGDIQKGSSPSSDLPLSPLAISWAQPGCTCSQLPPQANQAPSTALGPLD